MQEQELVDRGEATGEHLSEEQVQVLAALLHSRDRMLRGVHRNAETRTKVGVTRTNKEETKKRRKTAKASRRTNRH